MPADEQIDPMAPVLFSRATEPVDRSRMVVAPPDFVGVGAMKSGTTWLQAQLLEHPEVFDIGQKELHFFDWFFETDFAEEQASAYVDRFARPSGMLAGEFTPRYMVDVWAPPLLAQVAPNARILVLLRDPVTRIDSHMRWPNTGQEMLPMFKAAESAQPLSLPPAADQSAPLVPTRAGARSSVRAHCDGSARRVSLRACPHRGQRPRPCAGRAGGEDPREPAAVDRPARFDAPSDRRLPASRDRSAVHRLRRRHRRRALAQLLHADLTVSFMGA